VDHLCHAPNPLDEEQALKIAHMLGAMDGQVNAELTDPSALRPVLATPDDVALVIPDDADPRMLEGFYTEAPEQTRYLVRLARNMAAGEGDSSDLVAAKRVVHTLKGSGSIIGLRGLTSLSHHLEDILEHFERNQSQVAKPVADALLDAAFCLEQMVGYLAGADDYPQQAQSVLQVVLDLANRIDRGEIIEMPVVRVGALVASQPSSSPTATFVSSHQLASPAPGTQSIVINGVSTALRVSVERIDELFRVSGEVSVHTAAMEVRLKALTEGARALLAQNLRVQKRLFELETVVDIRALTVTGNRGGPTETAAFDPLEMDQYNELHSTSRALSEEIADSRTLALHLDNEIAGIAGLQARQQRLNKDMQHLVIGTRMTEVGVLESRLQRTVRATCQATAKEAILVMEGNATLVDSEVLNRLAEPLLHLLRNAVDHGLERPDERMAMHKPPVGTVMLSFARQGQQVVLRCRDDGAGLDLPAIYDRALTRGLILPEQILSDQEIARLILLPGFSTRDVVSEVSGRGVGLDVVADWVRSMNGAIRISSQPGLGCTIEMRFAASLSTVQSLIVEVAGQRFGLPSVQVERAIPRGVGVFENLGGQLIYRHDKRAYPALLLAALSGLAVDAGKAMDEYDAVIIRLDDKVHVLAVDRLIDARELLVKSPGRFARHVCGVAGLSILGDGAVAVNLDLAQLLAGTGRQLAPRVATTLSSVSKPALLSVLIVDDALSVRTSLLQLVQDAGFRAEVARDGIDAINTLRTFRPDVVLTDLEMPNMNGVELTSHIRGRDDLKRMPIIMITSRSQDKHRQLAAQAGVDAYFTKPYNDSELLQTIRSAIAV
ncbi:MAG: response regulator, partial [Herminiimonas sp.]|nr:response regulator [Herminiimonas sp.]